jgi:hypothetical protein
MGTLIRRELVRLLSNYNAEYMEIYDTGFVGLVTMSYLWSDDAHSLEMVA